MGAKISTQHKGQPNSAARGPKASMGDSRSSNEDVPQDRSSSSAQNGSKISMPSTQERDSQTEIGSKVHSKPVLRPSISSGSRHSRCSRDSRISKRMSFYEIVDANELTSYLIVGNQPSSEDDEFLTRKKVMFVMNFSNTPLQYMKTGVEYKSYFLEDEEDADLLSILEVSLKALQEWKTKCIETNSRILIYSQYGLSRSCSVALAHLMKEERLTLKQAWNHLKECNPSAKPNEGFLLQLRQYEQKLYGKISMTITDFYSK